MRYAKHYYQCLYSKNNYNTGTQNTGSRVLRTSIRLDNDKLPEAHMKIQKSRRGRQVNVNAHALLRVAKTYMKTYEVRVRVDRPPKIYADLRIYADLTCIQAEQPSP